MFNRTDKKYQEAKKASHSLLENDTFVEDAIKNTDIPLGFSKADELTPVTMSEAKPSISLFGGLFGKRQSKTDVKLKESLIDNQISVR